MRDMYLNNWLTDKISFEIWFGEIEIQDHSSISFLEYDDRNRIIDDENLPYSWVNPQNYLIRNYF